jgi:succinate-acetate transporter protein
MALSRNSLMIWHVSSNTDFCILCTIFLSVSIFANSLVSPSGISPLVVIIMGITVTSSCLHICLISIAKSLYLSFLSLYFSSLLWSIRRFINQSYIWSVATYSSIPVQLYNLYLSFSKIVCGVYL